MGGRVTAGFVQVKCEGHPGVLRASESEGPLQSRRGECWREERAVCCTD